MIYLDHNATTPVEPAVVEAMTPFLGEFYGNPSSLYRWGRLVRDAVEQAREQVAALVDVKPNQVIFTSGGTEANNHALQAVLRCAKAGARLAVSRIEHSSVRATALALESQGWGVNWIPVDRCGQISVSALAEILTSGSFALVSCMMANNETGVIQPVSEVAALSREHRALFHTDAVQAAGKLPLDFRAAGAHLMSLSAHKISGPKGVGALIVDRTIDLQPLLYGGGQEHGLRGGTENVAGIVGFGKAAELIRTRLPEQASQLHKLRQRLEAGLETLAGITIMARQAPRLANTVQFTVAGVEGEMLVMALDRLDIAVSSGSACASGGGQPSPVLLAMGVDENLARSAIRVSLGKQNTEAEIDRFVAALGKILHDFGLTE